MLFWVLGEDFSWFWRLIVCLVKLIDKWYVIEIFFFNVIVFMYFFVMVVINNFIVVFVVEIGIYYLM